MNDGLAGLWVKRVLLVLLVVAAAAWGFKYGFPDGIHGKGEEEKPLVKLTVKNFVAATEAKDVLVVINVKKNHSEESKSLEEFLQDLEKRDVYSDQVLFAEVDGAVEPELAKQIGADTDDPRGHLGFYAGGVKLGELVGETDPEVIQAEIERYLKGLIKRVGPDWLPEVEGMQRVSSSQPVIQIEPKSP